MSKVVREKKMEVGAPYLYQAITEFESYPEFLPEVVSAKLRPSSTPSQATVDFELEVIKRFQYTLIFQMSDESEVSWTLEDSNFFKVNQGKWKLHSQGESATQVEYELEVGFGFFVPKMITKKLTEVNLPKMFEQFHLNSR